MEDPFEDLRGLSGQDDLTALNDASMRWFRDHIRSKIVRQYHQRARQAELQDLDVLSTEWERRLANAMCFDERFQKICLHLELGQIDQNEYSLKVDYDWIIGQYLPGFYDHFPDPFSWSAGVNFLTQIGVRAMNMARDVINSVLDTGKNDILRQDRLPSRDAALVKVREDQFEVNEYVTALFQLCQNESKGFERQNKLHDAMLDAEAIIKDTSAGLTATRALLQRYSTKQRSEQPADLDRFGVECMKALSMVGANFEIIALPDLSPREIDQVQKASLTQYNIDFVTPGELIEADDPEDLEMEIEQPEPIPDNPKTEQEAIVMDSSTLNKPVSPTSPSGVRLGMIAKARPAFSTMTLDDEELLELGSLHIYVAQHFRAADTAVEQWPAPITYPAWNPSTNGAVEFLQRAPQSSKGQGQRQAKLAPKVPARSVSLLDPFVPHAGYTESVTIGSRQPFALPSRPLLPPRPARPTLTAVGPTIPQHRSEQSQYQQSYDASARPILPSRFVDRPAQSEARTVQPEVRTAQPGATSGPGQARAEQAVQITSEPPLDSRPPQEAAIQQSPAVSAAPAPPARVTSAERSRSRKVPERTTPIEWYRGQTPPPRPARPAPAPPQLARRAGAGKPARTFTSTLRDAEDHNAFKVHDEGEPAGSQGSHVSGRPNEVLKRSLSFVNARVLSQRESEAADEQSILEGAVAYVREQMSSEHGFNEDIWTQECRKWGTTTSRLPSADAVGALGHHSYTPELLHDNIFHVRKLLQALRIMSVSKYVKLRIDDAETRLIMAFAAVRAATDPLPWVLTTDYILRDLWRTLLTESDVGTPSRIDWQRSKSTVQHRDSMKNYYNELALFAHGVVITAVVTRYRMHHGGADQIGSWYHRIFNLNPACGNPQCLRLLPLPSDHPSIGAMRGFISVGNYDARLGKRAARQFISNNRSEAFPCSVDLFFGYRPTPALCLLFFRFSHLYHHHCKAGRGKYYINAF